METRRHDVPFQCRASGPAGWYWEPRLPTAQALAAELAATAFRVPAGLDWRAQLWPFQRKIKVLPAGVAPTAHALSTEVAATPFSDPATLYPVPLAGRAAADAVPAAMEADAATIAAPVTAPTERRVNERALNPSIRPHPLR
jgi:hypothetical protein